MKLKWWEDSVDEVLFCFFIMVISCVGIWKLGKDGAVIASAAVGVLGVYIGARANKGVNGGGNNEDR